MSHDDATGITTLTIWDAFGNIWQDTFLDPSSTIWCTGVAGVSLPQIFGTPVGDATWN